MEKKFVFIKTKKETGKVYLEDMIYLEKELQKLIIHTLDREIQMYGKMEDMTPYLDERFLCCHRSYSFNMDRVASMRDQVVHMEGGREVPLGRETFRKAKRQYEAYMMDNDAEQLI